MFILPKYLKYPKVAFLRKDFDFLGNFLNMKTYVKYAE